MLLIICFILFKIYFIFLRNTCLVVVYTRLEAILMSSNCNLDFIIPNLNLNIR